MNRFAPYLFDRLIDDAGSARETGLHMTLSAEQLKDTVIRDLEALLNTRRTLESTDADALQLTQRSVVGYGLEDLVSMSVASTNDQARICRRLESAIVAHEPRLRRVQVALNTQASSPQQLRFSIKALLCVAPLEEPVDLAAVLDAATQHYEVSVTRQLAR